RRRNRCRKPSWRCWPSRGGPSEQFAGESSSAAKELWKCRVRGKSGKPNPGFPLFPPPLGNLANPARFPHSHSSGGSRLEKWKTKIRFPTFPPATRDDDDDSFQNIKIKTKPRRLRRPKNKPKKGELHAAKCHLRTPDFQAHLA